MSSIVASVCIQTMSLHDSTASLLNLDDRQGTKSLRVNLSGVQIRLPLLRRRRHLQRNQ